MRRYILMNISCKRTWESERENYIWPGTLLGCDTNSQPNISSIKDNNNKIRYTHTIFFALCKTKCEHTKKNVTMIVSQLYFSAIHMMITRPKRSAGISNIQIYLHTHKYQEQWDETVCVLRVSLTNKQQGRKYKQNSTSWQNIFLILFLAQSAIIFCYLLCIWWPYRIESHAHSTQCIYMNFNFNINCCFLSLALIAFLCVWVYMSVEVSSTQWNRCHRTIFNAVVIINFGVSMSLIAINRANVCYWIGKVDEERKK